MLSNSPETDFAILVKSGLFFDKSMFIPMVLRVQDIKQFVMPAGTGKTVMLSMLRYFCEPVVNGVQTIELFKNLQVGKNVEWMQQQGQRPVCYLDLSDIHLQKEQSFDQVMFKKIAALYQPYVHLRHSDALESSQKERIEYFLTEVPEKIDEVKIKFALKYLYAAICQSGEKGPLLLIDGYDETALNKAQIKFFQSFFCELKSFHSGAIFMSTTEASEALPDRCRKITIRNDTFSPYFYLTPEQLSKSFQVYGLAVTPDVVLKADFPGIEVVRNISDEEARHLPSEFRPHDEYEAYYREVPSVNYKLGTVAQYIRAHWAPQPPAPVIWLAPGAPAVEEPSQLLQAQKVISSQESAKKASNPRQAMV